MDNKPLKVLLAAGIYPPDIGGPATFVKILHNELPVAGCQTKVLTYGEGDRYGSDIFVIQRKQNIVSRYARYFRQAWELSKWADVIYIFDLMAAGFPCALIKIFKPKTKLVVRLGGDYQWEKAIQNGYFDDTMEKYFHLKKFNLLESVIFRINNFVLTQCDKIIFNALILRDIYVKERGINPDSSAVIKNVMIAPGPNMNAKIQNGKIAFLYLGRVIAFKNIIRSIKALAKIRQQCSEKIIFEIIGEGAEKPKIAAYIQEHDLGDWVILRNKLDQPAASQKMAESDIIVLPSLTEVNAHTAAEAQAQGKIMILSLVSESYYVGDRSSNIFYVDPLSVDDIASKMLAAIDMVKSPGQAAKQDQAAVGETVWGLERVINEHIKIFNTLNDK